MLGRRRRIKRAAIDSSGFEAGQVSPYFVKRLASYKNATKTWQKTTYTRFPKLNMICDYDTHLILVAHPSRGPRPDTAQMLPTLNQLVDGITIDRLLGDAGYDSEPNHSVLRDQRGVKSFIPPLVGRPTTKPPSGDYRRLMKKLFCYPTRIHYGQRWQAENIFPRIKRKFGCSITAKKYWSQGRQMLLLVLTHNAAILWQPRELFYRAGRTPFVGI